MAAAAGVFGDILVTSPPSVALPANLVLTNAGDNKTYNNPTASQRYWDDTSAPTVQIQQDEYQSVTITGGPTGGTFTLTFGANTTTPLNWNCTAAQMQTALQALASIGSGNALVTGGPGPGTAFTVEFTGTLGFAPQALLTASGAGLTGGTSPSVAVARVNGGLAWTTQAATLYAVRYVNGAIIWNAAQTASTQTRISATGKYFPYASIGNTTDWTALPIIKQVNATTHKGVGGTPWEDWVLVTGGGTFTLKKWWIDETFVNSLIARTRLIISCLSPTGNRFEAYGYIKDDGVKLAAMALVEEPITFQCTGQIYAF